MNVRFGVHIGVRDSIFDLRVICGIDSPTISGVSLSVDILLQLLMEEDLVGFL